MLETLILCMALDYLTGMMAAGIFHKSKKSAQEVWKAGVAGKDFAEGISLLIVLVAYRLDLIAGTDFICNAVMAAYLVNELLSITENLGFDGCTGAKGFSGAIDLLRQKSEAQKTNKMPRKQKAKREQLIKREKQKHQKREGKRIMNGL